ncbi:hypothetical protein I5F64_22370, partial [Pseudomonas aeruginosa]|nr:hypothetical protein [Pseudomonas aeruginosa]
FLAGLLALAGVLGVGEGHLLHRKALRVKSADFAKSGSLFQSFLRKEKAGITARLIQLQNGNDDDKYCSA